jgi:UDP-N-acetylmuramoyl-tripeptide--D-alanyl-D-alanine ligase
MKLKNLLYLAQLEEYDLKRIDNWLKANPDKTVHEIKGKLKWTSKAKSLFALSSVLSLFLGTQNALFAAIKIQKPFDNLIKNILVSLADFKFKNFNSRTAVIGITGSWGKTTTKEVLNELLKDNYKIVLTPENQNTLLAIAKQILKLPSDTEIFICEMGAYYPGDIKKVCNLVHPKIGILTAVGPMHMERFGSLENILKTKMELIENLPQNGMAFVSQDLEKQIKGFKVPSSLAYFDSSKSLYSEIGKIFNLNSTKIESVLANIGSPQHRQEIIKANGLIIIDDTYNSNPAGFKRALEKLKNTKSSLKILVTPGMIELGPLQNELNFETGKLAAAICDHIIVVGKTNQESLESGVKSAKTKTKLHLVSTLTDAQILLPQITKPESAILFENDLPDNYF